MQKFSSAVIMDASASPKPNADIKEVYGLLLTAIDNNNYSTPMNQRSTIIKYTKLPDFDIESKAWPITNYTLQPRVRRIVTLGDVELRTNRSLKPDYLSPGITANFTKRKIVTIDEDDENDLHPKFSKEKRITPRTSNRSVGIDIKEEKSPSHRTISRLTNSSKYTKDIKASNKIINACKKEVNVSRQIKNKQVSIPSVESNKTRHVKDKDIVKQPKSSSVSTRSSISKHLVTPSESEKELLFSKNKLSNPKSKETHKKTDKIKHVNSIPPPNKNKTLHIKELQTKSQPVTVIRVPLDDTYKSQSLVGSGLSSTQLQPLILGPNTTSRSAGTDVVIDFKNVNIGTDPVPKTIDRITDMEDFEMNPSSKYVENSVQTESIKETFDSLEIPNVTLTKEKVECNRNNLIPNLEVPAFKIIPQKEEFDARDINFCKNASYIISRATLTYTTRQKINFHVVGSSDGISSSEPPSPLAYPMNIVSVFKNELSKETDGINMEDDSDDKKNESNINSTNCLNELKSLNCSYFFNSTKLMKPSDVISTITVNNGLLQSDYISEQFQRELNFIDSFFESLQYLESCSLSEKCFAEDKVENFVHNSPLFDSGFDVKNSEYDNFLSKIENGTSVDDAETMASKSLCLLNLLIRDEQRRAKNLLFVLKMREDALKDFTKSQILWLEKKKKQENTDIPTLKKKQRGALLKLQHECGEMQRMRKALLTLSEKRKVALMKTKKNIELKLKNNVDVEQIIFGKKKLKRNTPSDRSMAPLKCFDLSSSGCEDSTTSRPNSEAITLTPKVPAPHGAVTSAEKCIQTGDSVLETVLLDQSTNTAAENFVVVDGGYLNILFNNLTLPQIFSNGKQYEVNEEALKNIVTSTNSFTNTFNGSGVVEKFIEQIKNQELDRSSSPSTARSLVDEFDQYYKGLADTDLTPVDSPERKSPEKVREIKDIYVQTADLSGLPDDGLPQNISTMPNRNIENTLHNISLETERSCGCDPLVQLENLCQSDHEYSTRTGQIQTGPLPVPVGEAALPDSPVPSIPPWLPPNSSESTISSDSLSSQPLCASVSSITSIASPVQSEAEELRRQQIAIEMEIKALEQQQCRLLAVREIPDKPPPPYTPPAEPRVPKPPRLFTVDKCAEDKIAIHITDPEHATFDPTDPFDTFLKDFCHETLERHKDELSDKPWDACNLLPQKPSVDNEKLVQETAGEIREILTGVVPTVVSGFSSRRSDHIDDILFTEWRRCEPEWTTLHTDEAIVKNQLFESIFQKILTETIDEYRRTVQSKTAAD